ncbi:unnamed protein product [Polarella glacialis]|uniref:Uncharacterized protein n=1 Tax=Polarella glacialis TaxID=89957 RepID=A0A813IX85_POLGL|nr:unnamed protein product [Polarella glacialis]
MLSCCINRFQNGSASTNAAACPTHGRPFFGRRTCHSSARPPEDKSKMSTLHEALEVLPRVVRAGAVPRVAKLSKLLWLRWVLCQHFLFQSDQELRQRRRAHQHGARLWQPRCKQSLPQSGMEGQPRRRAHQHGAPDMERQQRRRAHQVCVQLTSHQMDSDVLSPWTFGASVPYEAFVTCIAPCFCLF